MAKKPPSAGVDSSRPGTAVVRTLSGLSDDSPMPRSSNNVSWDTGLLSSLNSNIGGIKPGGRADSVDFLSPLKKDVALLRGLLFDVVRTQVSTETMEKLEIISKLSSEFHVEAEDATFTTIAGTIGNLSEEELQLVRFVLVLALYRLGLPAGCIVWVSVCCSFLVAPFVSGLWRIRFAFVPRDSMGDGPRC